MMKMISHEYAGKIAKERKSPCAVCRKSVGITLSSASLPSVACKQDIVV